LLGEQQRHPGHAQSLRRPAETADIGHCRCCCSRRSWRGCCCGPIARGAAAPPWPCTESEAPC
jgi:hypothetical protein